MVGLAERGWASVMGMGGSVWWRRAPGVVLLVLMVAGCTDGSAPGSDGASSSTLAVSGSATESEGSVGPGSSIAPTSSPVAEDGQPVTSAGDLLGPWQTVQLDGEDVAAIRDRSGDPLFIRFFKTQGLLWWRANDGCNEHSGRVSITSDGQFRAEVGLVTAVGCFPEVTLHPRNPKVVIEADQARITAPPDTVSGRQLTLLRDGKVLAEYVISESL
jgi:hypothetical protein